MTANDRYHAARLNLAPFTTVIFTDGGVVFASEFLHSAGGPRVNAGMSDYDDDEDDGGGASSEAGFGEETAGALLAGRYGELCGLTGSGLNKLKADLEALGKARGVELTLVPAGDYTDTGPGPDDACWGSFVVGLLHGTGGTYGPEKLTRERLLEKLEAARAIPAEVWQAAAELMPENARDGFLQGDVLLQLVAVGPLAHAMVAFGAVGAEEDAGQGEYFSGTDMEQEPHAEGVWGQLVVSGEDPRDFDLSEAAHQARASAFPGGEYFVIARYD